MTEHLLPLLAGFVLDVFVGDPEGFPHPVIFIGRWIAFWDKRLQKRGKNLRLWSVALTASTVLISAAAAWALTALAGLFGAIPRFVVSSFICWTCLSARCLAKEALAVRRALSVSVEKARERIARLVGRDTRQLNESDIIRAAVETVAENTTDGIVSPLFWGILGGPVLMMAFKAVSTLDSMVGYNDDVHRDIGWSGARADDAMNFIPARLTAFLMVVAAFLLNMDGRRALTTVLRDHRKHLSPNCAWSEAAAAGALGIMLGGSHVYNGVVVEKPAIGDDLRPPVPRDIGFAVSLMWITAIEAALLTALFTFIGRMP